MVQINDSNYEDLTPNDTEILRKLLMSRTENTTLDFSRWCWRPLRLSSTLYQEARQDEARQDNACHTPAVRTFLISSCLSFVTYIMGIMFTSGELNELQFSKVF